MKTSLWKEVVPICKNWYMRFEDSSVYHKCPKKSKYYNKEDIKFIRLRFVPFIYKFCPRCNNQVPNIVLNWRRFLDSNL